ncbi:hypothetical protein LESZY_00510 [Brevundimonas phage vB_BpoS-Leszy]|mgnify:CR=1 FL=1|nr:hypothetical protein LESZY_00510 [Brevundimonas phage vB_BpoS-Leszy]USN16514.1 hypothetical protein POLUDNITSA_00990 [Brevundimonas phage vB_BpoS-Poludnitsa]USN16669.1 hypothetical protein FANBOY_00620 [Brevundimonas phage vB_BgoS-Fanboy]
MKQHAIPADSVSYPTHAVIIHQGITDGAERYAVWMLSWALFNSMFARKLALIDPLVDQRRSALAKLVGTRREFDIFGHLRQNHRRSIDYFVEESRKDAERKAMEAASA